MPHEGWGQIHQLCKVLLRQVQMFPGAAKFAA
jgi:hypothetical protein